eukprot:1989987-Prymnesium_polylepis.1
MAAVAGSAEIGLVAVCSTSSEAASLVTAVASSVGAALTAAAASISAVVAFSSAVAAFSVAAVALTAGSAVAAAAPLSRAPVERAPPNLSRSALARGFSEEVMGAAAGAAAAGAAAAVAGAPLAATQLEYGPGVLRGICAAVATAARGFCARRVLAAGAGGGSAHDDARRWPNRSSLRWARLRKALTISTTGSSPPQVPNMSGELRDAAR